MEEGKNGINILWRIDHEANYSAINRLLRTGNDL